MLKAVGLTIRARGREILDGVSCEVPRGAIATVLGPSGSGKTTLLRTIQGLERPDAGELYFGAACLEGQGARVPPERRGMSLVFQEFTLFPNLDVLGNLAFGLARPRVERSRLAELLALLEIEHLRKRKIDRLSGGEQQRVALARALAVRPEVLLMDEPFSNIDIMLRERLYRRLRERIRRDGITAVIATHDHKEAFFFSDTILVLKDGALIDQNPPREIYEQPANAWVAEFFGQTNLLTGAELAPLAPGLAPSRRYLVRPEGFAIGPWGGAGLNAVVRSVVYYGAYQDLALDLEDGGTPIRVRCPGTRQLEAGDSVVVTLADGVAAHGLE